MAEIPALTKFQKQILRIIFRDLAATPQSIAKQIGAGTGNVANAIRVLRVKGYVQQNPHFGGRYGATTAYRPLRSLNGAPVARPTDPNALLVLEQYLANNKIVYCPPAIAAGAYRSNLSGHDL